MRTHVCLVSRRAAVNLLAALDPLRRPGQVVLVATDKMQGHAADLQAVLQAQAIQVEQLRLHDAGDFQHAKARLLALAGELASHDVAINITGGPRLVAFAALAVAGASGWRAGALSVLGDEIRFSDEAARDFVKGGWLEFHAMEAVSGQASGLIFATGRLGCSSWTCTRHHGS